VATAVLCAACSSTDDPAASTDDTAGDTRAEESSSSAVASMSVGDSTEVTTDPADSSGTGSTDTGAEPCVAPSTCLPAIEAEWQGPVAIGEPARGFDACEGHFVSSVATLYDDLSAPPAECTCSCEVDGSPTCADAIVRNWNDDACAGEEDQEWAVGSACDPSISVPPATAVQALLIQVEGVTCEAAFTEAVDPAQFEREFLVCAAEGTPQACENGGSCLPEVSAETVCVWRDGDFECPAEWSVTRRLHYRDFIDERRCSDCTCDEFQGVCSGQTVTLFGTDSCNEAPVGGVSPGSCTVIGNQGATAARVTGVGVPDVDCSENAQGGVPVGAAGPTSPVTLCCLDL